jgi:pyruvate, orthophosphate dikinase
VGDLMRIVVERGRSLQDDLKLGICGEHRGEAASVAFCHELGLDYVSCSPHPSRSRGWGRPRLR